MSKENAGAESGIEVLDVSDGNASVCCAIGDALYEDPAHADIPRPEAEMAAREYAGTGLSAADVRCNWDRID